MQMTEVEIDNVRFAFRALCKGGRLEHEGYTWVMGEDGDVCSVANNEAGGEGYLRSDMSVRSFFTFFKNLSYETKVVVAGNLTLQEMADERIKQRESYMQK